jgi:hypothetical protein
MNVVTQAAANINFQAELRERGKLRVDIRVPHVDIAEYPYCVVSYTA